MWRFRAVLINEISDDCCKKFVVDFAEMASAHDTVSDVSDIGAEFYDSSDFLEQNQTVICRLDSSTLTGHTADTADSLPATTQSTVYRKIQLQEYLFNFHFLRNIHEHLALLSYFPMKQ